MPPRLHLQTCQILSRPRPLRSVSRVAIPTPKICNSSQHAALRLPIRGLSTRTPPASQKKQTQRSLTPWVASAGLLVSIVAFYTTQIPPASLDASQVIENSSQTDDSLPRFRLSEIRKHNGSSGNPWIVHGTKVYDITDWVPAHPGGDVILRAAGGSIDRYWDIFAIHKSQYVYDILSQYLIGYVDSADLTPDGSRPAQSEDVEDPFSDDPARHADLITRTLKPRNAESPGYALEASFLTPNDLFYVRNHMWVPTVADPEQHTLTVELPDGSAKKYTLHDLKTRFPQRTVTAALQCSGNRRSNMSRESGRKANGLPWDTGAISNAQWHGVLLADVLADSGFKPDKDDEVKHVHFSAMEAYAASIPIRKAADPLGDVLLAWGMNGQDLPRDHGFPLRSIVPGHVAARSVKWLDRITLSDEESPSQWQRRDYKCFGPNQTTSVDWDAAPAIQEMPVQSAVTAMKLGQEPGGEDGSAYPISLGGYAYSGGGREIIRVDVSVDGGQTWSQARLLPDCSSGGGSSPCSGHGFWAWKRWRFEGKVPAGVLQQKQNEAQQGEEEGGDDTKGAAESRVCTTVVVKATDETYNTQPESHAATWNIRGNLASAWHRVRVCTDCLGQQKQD
ncbi:unnamed protein product [Clonostachys byssicola]|uniref:Nitrate reductase [NADPH] n=1 Tax=Clonostachys byssicola TaxID=160290 RepID=A0A9N9UW76_9HYPO|nr:unnamed protein product [Clonostachys byssicola]